MLKLTSPIGLYTNILVYTPYYAADEIVTRITVCAIVTRITVCAIVTRLTVCAIVRTAGVSFHHLVLIMYT